MGSHFTSKADDSLTLSRIVEVFKCGDRNCPLLFFFPLSDFIDWLIVCVHLYMQKSRAGRERSQEFNPDLLGLQTWS